MKEIIYNIDGVAGRAITLTGLTGTFTKNNVLGIINKSQGDVLYTPMDWNLLTFAYSNGTMTLTLANSIAAIAAGDKLFIKLYTDDAAGGYDEMVARFLNLPDTLPSGYHAMETTDVLRIADEEWLAMYGFVAVANTVHTVDGGGSEREFTTYMNPNKTYADYGWTALWDAEGETIALTDHPTAGRDIYTYNPSNNE